MKNLPGSQALAKPRIHWQGKPLRQNVLNSLNAEEAAWLMQTGSYVHLEGHACHYRARALEDALKRLGKPYRLVVTPEDAVQIQVLPPAKAEPVSKRKRKYVAKVEASNDYGHPGGASDLGEVLGAMHKREDAWAAEWAAFQREQLENGILVDPRGNCHAQKPVSA